jgi:hypothetical protein
VHLLFQTGTYEIFKYRKNKLFKPLLVALENIRRQVNMMQECKHCRKHRLKNGGSIPYPGSPVLLSKGN